MRALLAMVLVWLAIPAAAHEVRPAYLEIIAANMDGHRYDVVWKQPVLSGRRLSMTPVFGPDCERDGAIRSTITGNAVVERWAIACQAPLQTVGVDGLDRTLTDVFVRVTDADGDAHATLLRPTAASLDLTTTPASPARAYLGLGVEHILYGPDHLLFVTGIVLLLAPSGGWRRVVLAATAFTVAHSVTLALAALGRLSLPSAPVEIMIAASILLMAVEIMRVRRGRPSLVARHPWPVIFAIGLLHGLGFAGALADIGLPAGAEAEALILFNVGIEIGQIGVVILLMGTMRLLSRIGERVPARISVAATYMIGTAGAFWTLSRLAG
ncbi:MAG: HupE/UreJ family protein [Pseudomonadota bacterium]